EAGIVIVFSKRFTPILIIGFRHILGIPKKMFQNIIKKSLPVIINEGVWSLGMSAMALIYARISTTASAAVFIAETVRMIFTVLSFGVGNASAIMIGNLLGEGDRKKAIEYNTKFLQLNTILGMIMGGTVFVLAPFIVNGFYNLDREVADISIQTIRIIGIMLPFKFYNLVMIIGTFRAGGDTVFSMLIEAVSVWGVGVPAVYITGILMGIPVPYVVLAANADEVFKFFVGLPRVLSNKWAKTLV
ncbi:MAG: MATE family efflux transporter, partial [Bacillota bacterium]|nr:MATE family efflux transporter [Bacillota bacterium]